MNTNRVATVFLVLASTLVKLPCGPGADLNADGRVDALDLLEEALNIVNLTVTR